MLGKQQIRRHLTFAKALPALALLATGHRIQASDTEDMVNPSLLEEPWDTNWVTHPTASPHAFGVFHFRREFEVDAVPETFRIHVSADPRYRLFVNGASVSTGPAAGDQANWRFETVDIASELQTGKNVIAATVWNFGDHRPLAHHSYQTALIVKGDTESESAVDTSRAWKVLKDESYAPIPVSYADVDGYFAASPGERFDANQHPWGWLYSGFNDDGWTSSREIFAGTPKGANPFGNLYGWSLVPREIPPMEERQLRVKEVRRTLGVNTDGAFLQGTGTLTIPPNTTATLLLDQSFLTNAYPTLTVSGGRGATIRSTYAESLRHGNNRKGNRNEIEGKSILGLSDVFITDGGDDRTLQTLWLRTYRYIQLDIETQNDALELHDFYGVFTGYPFEENAVFSSNDDGLQRIWDVGWRTARLNAFETYWDCPYYEQLQYVGDTRIQALISLYVSGDDRLMRKAIRHFDNSRSPEGITMSRYPSRHPQYIPPYSLLWIAMVHDYWMHRDDEAFVEQFLPGIRSVVAWYERHLEEDNGLLGPMPWWNFVDGGQGSARWNRGVPPGGDQGDSIVITLQMLYTVRYAAALAAHFENSEDASYYRRLIKRLRQSIQREGWDSSRNLYADTPEFASYSQHANILALLSDMVPVPDQTDFMRRIMEDDSLTQASYYFKFYFFRALSKSGLGHLYLDQMQPWYDALELGMTTFPEYPEPTRSDAHAWSSSPNYDFLATVTGIRPDSPGFASVLIEPKPGHLDAIQAEFPHPKGDIEVSLEFSDDAAKGHIVLPQGLSGRFLWNGVQIELRPGTQSINVSHQQVEYAH